MFQRDLQQLEAGLDPLQQRLDTSIARIADGLQELPVADVPALQAELRLLDRVVAEAQQWIAAYALTARGQEPPAAPPGDRHRFQARFGQFRNVIGRWPAVREVVHRQVFARRQRLLQRDLQPDSLPWAHTRLADDLFNALHLALLPGQQQDAARDSGAYPDIGMLNSVFVALMMATRRLQLARRAERTRFLDVGCGIGIKVLSAFRFFSEAAGLELDQGYAAAARRVLDGAGLGSAPVFEANALTFSGYGDYEVVYFFKPLRDPELLIELERRIATAVRPGTVLIAPYREFEQRHRFYGCARLARGLYLSGSSVAAARRLRQKAEWIGLAPLTRPEPVPDFWQPLISASQANGYDLFRPGRLDGV
ncbi:MAG: class I SAM-dependent methyltransferase [Pseudomonadota bacterium]